MGNATASVEGRLVELDDWVAALDVTLQSLVARNEVLEHLATNQAGEIADQRDQLERLRKAEAKVGRVASIERQLAHAHDELDDRAGELAVVRELEGSLRRALAASEARRERALASAGEARDLSMGLQERVIELEHRVRTFDAALTAIADRAAELELSAAELELSGAEARQEAARLRADADAVKLDGQRRELALERTTAALESELVEMTNLRSRLREVGAERDELTRMLDLAREREGDLQRELEQIRGASAGASADSGPVARRDLGASGGGS